MGISSKRSTAFDIKGPHFTVFDVVPGLQFTVLTGCPFCVFLSNTGCFNSTSVEVSTSRTAEYLQLTIWGLWNATFLEFCGTCY